MEGGNYMDKFINSLVDGDRFRFESVIREALLEYLQREKSMLPHYEDRLRNAKDFDSVCMRFYSFHATAENIRLIENFLSSF